MDASKLLGPERVTGGDVVIAMASSGLHSNGYSLVRSVVSRAGASLESHVAEFGRTLGEELLEPTRLYTRLCLDLVERFGVEGIHAYSHVTGGGLAANLSRVLPVGAVATVDRSTWTVPAVFDWVRRGGDVTWVGMEDSLNLGVGMVAVVSASVASEVLSAINEAGVGRVGPGLRHVDRQRWDCRGRRVDRRHGRRRLRCAPHFRYEGRAGWCRGAARHVPGGLIFRCAARECGAGAGWPRPRFARGFLSGWVRLRAGYEAPVVAWRG